MYSLVFSFEEFSICKLSEDEWSSFDLKACGSSFFSISKREEEISLILESSFVQKSFSHQDSGWCMFYLKGSFSFDAIAILAPILEKIGAVGVSILALSTFDTDCVFFKKESLDKVVSCLKGYYVLEFLDVKSESPKEDLALCIQNT